ncbi:Bcr/CflA family efflux MFS transporter [Colwellia psychrerythraea]|uniref:Bcr/CflA family efflux transporter n=1 Tax=Colwellia psychrerythraea TaxID=28229 RepID=A0A099KJE1_COLPS|nr:Bcr/CflA family efflux MFS transporter [Colwellia psychrerythraea]KGJ90949.1 drug resistance transporter, Bcr/CflA subfamily [Colwellia psychrerythraea]
MNTHTATKIGYWPFVILMAMIFSLSPLAIDMYLPGLPSMAKYFSTSIDAMEASVAIYLIFFALGQLILGSLADSINKAKLLSVGLTVFAIASIMIAFATSIEELYFWRAVQAFASGSSVVVFALIHHFHGSKNSNQIISYVMACVVIAPMIAPMIGSQILLAANWQWIFLVLAGLTLVTLATQLRLLPAKKVETELQPLNITALYSGYRKVLSNSTTMAYILAGGSAFAGLFAFISGSPFVYMEYFGATPEKFSWLVALNAVAMISMNLLNARLLNNVDATKKLIIAGFLLAVVGVYLGLVAFLHLSLVYVVVGVILYVGLLGLTAANAISAALASVEGNTGVLSGVNGVLQFGLGALASAVVSISVSIDATTMNYTMAICSLVTLFFVSILFFNRRIKAVAVLS